MVIPSLQYCPECILIHLPKSVDQHSYSHCSREQVDRGAQDGIVHHRDAAVHCFTDIEAGSQSFVCSAEDFMRGHRCLCSNYYTRFSKNFLTGFRLCKASCVTITI